MGFFIKKVKMLLINKGEINNIFVTLAEKTTLSNPTYLFDFVNDITRHKITFIAQDVSQYTYRYNQFVITETSGTNYLTSGVITLSESMFYSYRIFEQVSTTNLDVALTGGLVESGKLKVIGTTTNPSKYDNNPKQYITYG